MESPLLILELPPLRLQLSALSTQLPLLLLAYGQSALPSSTKRANASDAAEYADSSEPSAMMMGPGSQISQLASHECHSSQVDSTRGYELPTRGQAAL